MITTLPTYKAADPFSPTPFSVSQVRSEGKGVATLSLKPPDGERFAFRPGQFNMIYMFGVGEVPISISSSPENSTAVDHTIRSVGFVTRHLADIGPGETVGVRGPFGKGWPLDEARGKDVLIIAGGVGLAPLRSSVLFLLSHRQDYRRLILLYGARTSDDLLYKGDLKRWRGRLDIDVLVTIDRGDMSWRGNVGVVTSLFTHVRRLFEPTNVVSLICGPEIMMRFTVRELEGLGVPEDRIHVSMERNMKCAVGFCGHCQFGANFVCKEGPVFPYSRIKFLFGEHEF